MALNPTQIREVLAAVGAFIEKRRPPENIRPQLDYRADIDGSTVTLVAVRPAYKDPQRMLDEPIARVRWIGTQ
jgi:hypothetical protein